MTKLNLQLFAAQEGVTTTASITAQAREIDFVTSFTKSIQPLLDILGISRPIKKANGTTLYKTTASGTLKSGAVGEGRFPKLRQNRKPSARLLYPSTPKL